MGFFSIDVLLKWNCLLLFVVIQYLVTALR